MILYDLLYLLSKVYECYKLLDKTVDLKTTKSIYWTNHKKINIKNSKAGGKVITFVWNSGGIGKKYDFEIKNILLVAHGGWHNDTICIVEIKK